jgi:hypothetical protein
MHKEHVFKAAFVVAFFWSGVYIALHPDELIFTESSWAAPAMMLLGIVGGLVYAFMISVDTANERIERLRPEPEAGLNPSIGRVPVHLREPAFIGNYDEISRPDLEHKPEPIGREALKRGFALLKADENLVPKHIRRSLPPEGDQDGIEPEQVYRDGIDLDLIERTVLGFDDASVAVFDKLLRIFLAHRHLLSTYEQEGHGRTNGQGGRTLLQHSLLVCQCAIEMAEKFVFRGMYAVDEYGKPTILVYPLRHPEELKAKGDPIPILAAFAHDIGKIECYVWEKGKPEPVALRPNHDTVGARMLGRIPELWRLPVRDIRGIREDDRTLLMTIVGFYHHPTEQPMEVVATPTAKGAKGAGPRREGFGSVMVRSDRQVGFMELLIDADTRAGAIENDAASKEMAKVSGGPVDAGEMGAGIPAGQMTAPPAAAGGQPKVVPGFGQITPELVSRNLWEAIETVLGQTGRINATYARGVVNAGSVGLMFHLPHWGGSTLILKESDFINAVIEAAELPDQWKRAQQIPESEFDRGNSVAPATTTVLRMFAERGLLVLPPGAPPHSPETSLWKVEFHKPTHIYPHGDVSAPPKPEPGGKRDFLWGSTIIIRPGKTFPDIESMESYERVVPHYVGERMGAAGRVRLGRKSAPARRSVLEDADAITAMSAEGVAEAQEIAARAEHDEELELIALAGDDANNLAGQPSHVSEADGDGASAPPKPVQSKAPVDGSESVRIFGDQVEAMLRHGQLDYIVATDGNSVVLRRTFEDLVTDMSLRGQREQIEAYANANPDLGLGLIVTASSDGVQFRAVSLRKAWLKARGLERLLEPGSRTDAPALKSGKIGPVAPPAAAPAASSDPAKAGGEARFQADQADPDPSDTSEAGPAQDGDPDREPEAATLEDQKPTADLAWYEGVQRRRGEGSRKELWQRREAVRGFDIGRLENAFVAAMLDKERAPLIKLVCLDDPRNGEEVVVCVTPLSKLVEMLGIQIDLPPAEEIRGDGFGLTPTKDRSDLVIRILPRWMLRNNFPIPPKAG